MGSKINGKIPVIIGVTGHRDLRKEDIGILREAVREQIGAVRAKCPHSEVRVMTSLAEGADQLCAETALEMGLDIITVLPMPAEEYAEDFKGEPLNKFSGLYEKTLNKFSAPHKEEFRAGRDYLYRQAENYIAEHSHVLLALWDGEEEGDEYAGTAATVRAKLGYRANEVAGEQLKKSDGAVIQIVTPRQSSDNQAMKAGKVYLHGDVARSDRILSDTDSYNRDCGEMAAQIPADAGQAAEESGPQDRIRDRVQQKVQEVYNAADSLSVINAVRHRRTLIGLSTCATVLTIAFLLYDEAEWQTMIILCGFMIIALFAINKFTRMTGFHSRYIEYRVLAEACRVQNYLRSAGSSCEVTEIMPWNLQVTVPWVNRAMAAVMIGERSGIQQSIVEMWIRDQADYQKSAFKRSEKQMKRNDLIVGVGLAVSIISYFGALAFEIICCGMLGGENMFTPEVNDTVRAGIKIAMGTFSAFTLFANNYYGNLALPNVIDDHRKMMLLYEEAEREIADKGEAEPLLIRIAEDELGENANWYAYQSKHEPGMDI